MDFSLSPEQQALRDEIVEFARRELNEGVRHRDENRSGGPDITGRDGRSRIAAFGFY